MSSVSRVIQVTVPGLIFHQGYLRVSSKPCIPQDIPKKKLYSFSSALFLQIEDIKDISESVFSQYNREVIKINSKNKVEGGKPNSSNNAGNDGAVVRMLKFTLTDGVQKIFAAEKVPIMGFSLQTTLPGSKVRLENSVLSFGIIWLKPEDVSILGGVVSELSTNYCFLNSLAKILGLPASHSSRSSGSLELDAQQQPFVNQDTSLILTKASQDSFCFREKCLQKKQEQINLLTISKDFPELEILDSNFLSGEESFIDCTTEREKQRLARIEKKKQKEHLMRNFFKRGYLASDENLRHKRPPEHNNNIINTCLINVESDDDLIIVEDFTIKQRPSLQLNFIIKLLEESSDQLCSLKGYLVSLINKFDKENLVVKGLFDDGTGRIPVELDKNVLLPILHLQSLEDYQILSKDEKRKAFQKLKSFFVGMEGMLDIEWNGSEREGKAVKFYPPDDRVYKFYCTEMGLLKSLHLKTN
ncbi:uncharacterized protein LOC135121968 [Zophobas morio]|uniref:uncharacterized protein LOC135121968 n=1 Tax=Zophobas morio TaxID=2755281 RepID=UPI003082D1E4